MPRLMDRTEVLRRVSVFEGLSEDDLAALAPRMQERVLRAGQVLFMLGDRGSAMFVIASGQVNIFLPGEGSRRLSLKDLGEGEYFGEMSLFDEKPRSASAMASTDVLLLELTKEMLTEFLERRPRASLVLLRTMVERLRETNQLLSQRATKNAVEEFEKGLHWRDRLADRVAELNGSWTFIVGLLLLTLCWAFINSPYVLHKPFDEFPFVFFNLLLAILVALQGPLIMMSQNRQTAKERAQAEADFQVNLKNEVHIETILREMGEMRVEVNSRLDTLEAARALSPASTPAPASAAAPPRAPAPVLPASTPAASPAASPDAPASQAPAIVPGDPLPSR
jgi:uncharacterized membrane protein